MDFELQLLIDRLEVLQQDNIDLMGIKDVTPEILDKFYKVNNRVLQHSKDTMKYLVEELDYPVDAPIIIELKVMQAKLKQDLQFLRAKREGSGLIEIPV